MQQSKEVAVGANHPEKAHFPLFVSNKRAQDINRLQKLILNATTGLFDGDEPFAILDFPDHYNIGDSAIYVGELNFLRHKGKKPSYVASVHSCPWDELDRAVNSGPLFLHGGGNFGDLWAWHHPFREAVLERYVGRPIIQFPQTIYYRSQQNIDRTAHIIERHGAFTLLVRDQKSYDFARASFQCDVRMCPDVAYFIGPIKRQAPTHDLVLHLRRDQEAAEKYDADTFDWDNRVLWADWPEETPDFHRRSMLSAAPALAIAYARGGRRRYLEMRYRTLAKARLQRGIKLLSSGRFVITDRLHGHILNYLMDMPQSVLDNNYGKTSNFMNTWGLIRDNVTFSSNLEEAVVRFKQQCVHHDS